MDFSAQLDTLQRHAAAAKAAADAAATESRNELKQRIDRAQADWDQAARQAQQQASEVAAAARSKWARM